LKKFDWPLLVAVALWLPGCVYDPDKRCGPNQELIANDTCVCAAGSVLVSGVCQVCPEGEHERNGTCECQEGFARPSVGATCEPKPGGLGEECDPASAMCGSATFDVCHAVDDVLGYCTNACRSSDDCIGGFRCQDAGAHGYCRRPATGYGDACSTADDCTGNEASYCEMLQSHVCVVPCQQGGNECFEGESCCDLSVFGGSLICVPEGKCPTKAGG
jgi:hypothetical protein